MEFALFAILNLWVNCTQCRCDSGEFYLRTGQVYPLPSLLYEKDFECMGAGFVCFVLSIRRPVHLERLTFNFIMYVMRPELQFIPDYFCGRDSIKLLLFIAYCDYQQYICNLGQTGLTLCIRPPCVFYPTVFVEWGREKSWFVTPE